MSLEKIPQIGLLVSRSTARSLVRIGVAFVLILAITLITYNRGVLGWILTVSFIGGAIVFTLGLTTQFYFFRLLRTTNHPLANELGFNAHWFRDPLKTAEHTERMWVFIWNREYRSISPGRVRDVGGIYTITTWIFWLLTSAFFGSVLVIPVLAFGVLRGLLPGF